MLSELDGVTHSVRVASLIDNLIGFNLAHVTESYPLCEIGASHKLINTVDGSPFSRNDFLRRVSKKLLPLVTSEASNIAFVGKYAGLTAALAVTQSILIR